MLEDIKKRICDLVVALEHSAAQHNMLVGRKAEAEELLRQAEKLAIGVVEDVAKAEIPGGEIIVPAVEKVIEGLEHAP